MTPVQHPNRLIRGRCSQIVKSGRSAIQTVFLIVCCALLIVCSIVVLSQKEAMFLDEYSSYGCANSDHNKLMRLDDGICYSREEVLQEARDTYAINRNEWFRYDFVWRNLKTNVHPPVFYVLLHFVCSFTPDLYSIWQAAAVNLFFGLISLVFFQKFARALIRSEWLAGILCLSWACTLGLYGNIVLLRDYAAAMCGMLISAWECLRYLRGNRSIRDLVKIALASALSVLSHYYCILALFLLCGTLCVILAVRKEWKDLRNLILAEACAAVAAAAVFPAMIPALFSSSRSTESSGNLASLNFSQWKEELFSFFTQLNNSFFGGLLLWVGLLVLAAAVICLFTRKKSSRPSSRLVSIQPDDIALLLIPSSVYFILVSKMVPLSAFRYHYPVTAQLYLSVFALLAFFSGRLLKKKALALFLAAVMLTMCCFSWPRGEIEYLYRGTKSNIQAKLEPYRGTDAVFLRSGSTNPNALLPQMEYYGSLTICQVDDSETPAEIPALREGKDLVLAISKSLRKSGFIDLLLSEYPGYEAVSLGNLDGQGKIDNYYLHHTP